MKGRPKMPDAPLPVVTLVFPDGTELAGASDRDVLERLGRLQWTPVTPEVMKGYLSDRVWNLGQHVIDPELPDPEFLDALDQTTIVLVRRANFVREARS